MDTLTQIENYIIYLITECDLSVTLHPLRKESLITFSRLMRFNIHDNSYCSYIKTTQQGRERCRAQQKKVLHQCEKGDFCGHCYAGVFEYVYPLISKQETVGFISVSGYACPEGEGEIPNAAEQLGYSADTLKKMYATLRSDRPRKQKIDTLIIPLCQMLELAYFKENNRAGDETLIKRILRHVQQRYMNDITTEELCRKYHCSRSYFSHTFKKETGKNFREYLTEIRLDHAKRLLKYSKMRINEIAFSVGFNDSNYFSNLFRQKQGISPREYRMQNK